MALYNQRTGELSVPRLPNGKTVRVLQGFYDALRWGTPERAKSDPLNASSRDSFQAWPVLGHPTPESTISYVLTDNPEITESYAVNRESWLPSRYAQGLRRRVLDFSGVVLEVPDIREVELVGIIARFNLEHHLVNLGDPRLALPETTGPYAGVNWDASVVLAEPFNHAIVVTAYREQTPEIEA